MPLPKRRHSKARRDKRRAHDALSMPTYTYCVHCDAPIIPHAVCHKCGYYGEVQVIKIREKKAKESKA